MPKKKQKLIEVDKTGMPVGTQRLDQQLHHTGYTNEKLGKPIYQMSKKERLEQIQSSLKRTDGWCFCPACRWNREAKDEDETSKRVTQKKNCTPEKKVETTLQMDSKCLWSTL